MSEKKRARIRFRRFRRKLLNLKSKEGNNYG